MIFLLLSILPFKIFFMQAFFIDLFTGFTAVMLYIILMVCLSKLFVNSVLEGFI